MRYAVKLTKDDNGTFLVTSRDFPELTTFGDSVDDALVRAREAIEEAIAARVATGKEVPSPVENQGNENSSGMLVVSRPGA